MLSLFKKTAVVERVYERDIETIGDEPLGSFDLTKKKETLKDRIDKHQVGSPFTYVTLEQPDGRSKKTIMNHLLAFKSKSREHPVQFGSLPIFDLVKDLEVFNMGGLFKESEIKKMLNYVGIYEISLLIRPTDGFYGNHGKIYVKLMDNRTAIPTVRREITALSNAAFCVHLSLDYYVHKSNLIDLELTVGFPVSPFVEGTVWASMKAQISFKQSREALSPTIVPTTGYVALPVSAVSRPRTNPLSIDLSVNQGNIDALSRMRARGELRDLTKIGDDQKVVGYGGSEAGESVDQFEDDEEIDEDLKANLIKAALNRQRQQNRIEAKSEADEPVAVSKLTKASVDKPTGSSPVILSDTSEKPKPEAAESSKKSEVKFTFDEGTSSLVEMMRTNFSFVATSGKEKKLNDINNFFDIRAGMLAEDLAVMIYVNLDTKVLSHVPFEGAKEMTFGEFCQNYANVEFF